MTRFRICAAMLVVMVHLLTVAAHSQKSPKAPQRNDQLLVELGPSGSPQQDKKTLSVLMQLFELETVTVDPGTALAELSQKRCGRADASWMAEVRKANPNTPRLPYSEPTTLTLPPCAFWKAAGKTGKEVPVGESSTLSHQLILNLGAQGDKTLAAVAKINHRTVESLDAIQPGERIKLPYVTSFSSYRLKKEYIANEDVVMSLLKSAPGYAQSLPKHDFSLIVAVANSDCTAPADGSEWPFSTEKLRHVLEYNNTRRLRPLQKAIIAVADTGLEKTEDRLFLNVNGKEIPDNDIDDEGNGYVDDVYGANMNKDIPGFPALDKGYQFNEHGTHVSGLALGGLNDPELNKLVKDRIELREINIVFRQVQQGPSGAPFIDFPIPNNFLLDAFKYVTQYPAAQIINLSVEGDQASGLDDTLKNNSALVVAAAGNEGVNINEEEHYPAAANSRERLITVAAQDASGKLAAFSNWGQDKVDLAAPRCQIDSILPGGKKRGKMSGTSQAAPLVSFTAGLLYSEGLSIAQIKSRILTTTDYDPTILGNCAGADGGCVATKGRLDIVKALRVYEDVLVVQEPRDPQDPGKAPTTKVLAGRIRDACIQMDTSCVDVRTKLKRLIQDPATHQWQVWIKSRDNQVSSRAAQMNAIKISFQDTRSQKPTSIDISQIIDLVTAVY